MRILQKVDHPGVIKIHAVFDTQKSLYIVLELYGPLTDTDTRTSSSDPFLCPNVV